MPKGFVSGLAMIKTIIIGPRNLPWIATDGMDFMLIMTDVVEVMEIQRVRRILIGSVFGKSIYPLALPRN